MFLSNPQAAVAATLFVIFAAAGCSWFTESGSSVNSPTAVAPPETGIPFETSEPESYQADFLTIVAGSESRSHFARRSGKWRIDTFADGKAARSIIQDERLVHVDHNTKQFAEPPVSGPDAQPPFLADMTTSLLNERQPAKFEKLGSDGTLESYGVTVEGSDAMSTVIFDTSIKMVVRHEFEGGFVIEMRNFTLEVDDATFTIPAGYRKVAWSAFKQQ